MSDAISAPSADSISEKDEQPNPFIPMADRHDLLAAMADKPLQGFADVIGIDDADDTGKEATDGQGSGVFRCYPVLCGM